MKNQSLFIIVVSIIIICLTSCRTKCDQRIYFSAPVAVYTNLLEIRNSIKQTKPKPIVKVDQIVANSDAFFLLDKYHGVHIIDRFSDGTVSKSRYIEAQSCLEISTHSGYLIICQGPDVVTIDLSNNQLKEVSRVKDVLNLDFVRNDSFVVSIDMIEVEKLLPSADCKEDEIEYNAIQELAEPLKPNAKNSIFNNNIYSCDNSRLANLVIDSTTGEIQLKSTQEFGKSRFKEATIINNEKYLIVGQADNQLIPFSLQQNDGNPQLSSFRVQSGYTCGNVYLINNFLFFTGNPENIGNRRCGTLGRIIIKNFGSGSADFYKQLVFDQPMHISKNGNLAVVSDGVGGISVLDVSNPKIFDLEKDVVGSFRKIHAIRSVFIDNQTLVWGNNGLFLLDVTNPNNIIQKMRIE